MNKDDTLLSIAMMFRELENEELEKVDGDIKKVDYEKLFRRAETIVWRKLNNDW